MPVPVPPSHGMLVSQGAYNVDQPNHVIPASDSNQSLVPATPMPPEVTAHLLNTLLLFYQQRKGWVQRSRASLELAYVQGPLLLAPTIGSSSDEQSDSDGSAPYMSSSSNSTNEPTPATMTGMEGVMDPEDPVVKKEEEDEDILLPRTRNRLPLTLRATNAAQAPSSKWLKRKKSFKLHLGPLRQQSPTWPRRHTHTGAPEPSARLLELFGDLLEARMESCLRVNRLIRESNRSMLHTW